MSKHLETGRSGEELAKEYLLRKGYEVVALNWRHIHAEIDIIARLGTALVFVEVKTRSYRYWGPPDLYVDRKKEQLLAVAAQAYIEVVDHQGDVRFDIIAIMLSQDGFPHIDHIEDAFFPGLA